MAPGVQLTPQTVKVVRTLLANPAAPRWVRDLASEVDLAPGTLHPILTRLVVAGWVESFWEEPATPQSLTRPRRRYFRLTANGTAAATQAIAQANPTGSGPALPELP